MGKVLCPQCGCCFEANVNVAPESREKESEPHHEKKKVYLEWQDSYIQGIHQLDQEHKRLVEIINELHVAANSTTRDPNFVKKLIVDLTHYATDYLLFEEKMMKEVKYPNLEKHCLEHREFIKEIQNLHETFKKGVVRLRGVLTYLNTWFVKHSLEKDKEFASYYLKNAEMKKAS